MPGTNKPKHSVRSESARTRNNYPCGHCKKNRQRCDGGYPCFFCIKFGRAGCTRPESGFADGFIEYHPTITQGASTQHRHHRRPTVENMNVSNKGSRPSGGQISQQDQLPTQNNSGSGGYPGPSNNAPEYRSHYFGQTCLLGPNGQPQGYVETFIHTHNGTRYYGARYHDQSGQIIKEDMFLSLVGKDDKMEMHPPEPNQPTRSYFNQNQGGNIGTRRV